MIGRSLLPIGAGIVAGILGSVGASRLLAALLYRVHPDDPLVLVTIVVVLGTGALTASLMPARAAAVDPLIVLREE